MTNYKIRDKALLRTELLQNDVLLTDEFIGNGSYSIVCKGLCRNQTVAIKLIDSRTDNEYTRRFLPRECELIPLLHHQNVIEIQQIVECNGMVAIIQEYAKNGDLLNLIKKKNRLDEIESRFLFRQLIEAIRYLESIDIVHRDLKCENIFLDEYDNIKIGDFGFARLLRQNEESNTHCGSRAYVAPEFLRSERYSSNESDIWSAGVILYIMLTGKMPYNEKNIEKMLRDQTNHKIVFSSFTPSENAVELIKHMMHPRRELRANSTQIINSAWLVKCSYFMKGAVKEDKNKKSISSSDS